MTKSFKETAALLGFAAAILVLILCLTFPTGAWAWTVVADRPLAPDEVQVISPEVFSAATAASVAALIARVVNDIIVKLLGPWGFAAKLARLDQLLEKYIKGFILATLEKNKDLAARGVVFDLGSDWAAGIAREVLRVIPGWLLRFAGGKEGLEQKIRNRLPDVLKDLKLPLVGTYTSA